ncbi:MAG: M16 family metallopeptidase [Armatimonadota bacterium]|jgi:zinc protease
MTRARWGLLLAALGLMFGLQAAVADPVVETLDNGCRLVVEVDQSRPVAAVRVYVGAGSIHEGQYLGGGISHFLEHTISKGSQSRTFEEIEAELTALGNTYNAYTTKDHTCYFATVARDEIGRAIDVISDFVLRPTFPEEHVEIERGVIQREMAMGDDDPMRQVSHLLYETLFTAHPERYRIIGYPEVFNGLTRDEIVAYHEAMYVPDNIVVAVVGDIDGVAVLEQLRATFGAVPRRPQPAVELAREPRQIAPRRRVAEDEAIQRAYLRIAWPTIDLFHPDLYALDTLSGYLTAGESSLLVRRLRDELGLVDSISSYSATPARDTGFFAFAATLDPANLERVEEEIVAALDQIRDNPPPRREIERVLKQVEAGEVFAQESVEGRASSLGRNLMVTGDVNFTERYVEGIRGVRPRDLSEVARRYFPPERITVAILRPAAEADRGAAIARAAEKARTHERTLSNGLRVIVRENRAIPAVSIATATLGGLRYESAGNVGITSLMAQMLVRGTQHHTRRELTERIDRLGGSLAPYSGRNSFGLMGQFLAEDTEAALELTLEALFRPTFPDEELERERSLALAAIARRQDSAPMVALTALLDELFREHPYRFMPEGTEESVAALSEEDLRAFHEAYARPATTAIVVAGDVDAEATFAAVERLAGSLTADQPSAPRAPEEAAIEEGRERRIERPQQQAIVAYGFHGLTVDDPELPVMEVLDALISGASLPGGRLHEALRGQQLVYFVHGTSILGLDPGAYVIYAGTAPESVGTVREQIESTLAGIAAEAPGEDELALAKGMAVAAHRMSLQTNSSLAQTMALDVIYGRGATNWEQFAERIDAVTAGQVREMAERLLTMERSAVVVTTPATTGEGNEG